MGKRLIFDLDNTLVMFKDSYKNALKDTIKKYDLDVDSSVVDEVIKEYGSLIKEYEKRYNYYSKENMLEFLCDKLKSNLDISFVESWLTELEEMADIEQDVIDTLEYLSQKYELVILTNWFKETQFRRVQKVGIDKYFEEIYAGDTYIKPSLESYKTAMGNRSASECVMIGDSYEVDIEGAINIGLSAIMITNKDIESTSAYKVIRDIKELKEMF